MDRLGDLIVEAVVWSIVIIVVSQLVSLLIVWWLGVPPGKLEHEIEEKQNAAVGAIFFIVTLIISLFVSSLASNGFTEVDPTLAPADAFATGALWILGGVAFGIVLTFLNFFIVFRWMGRQERGSGESMYRYMQREIIDEHNLAFAFFLGGLATAPFIAVLYQII